MGLGSWNFYNAGFNGAGVAIVCGSAATQHNYPNISITTGIGETCFNSPPGLALACARDGVSTFAVNAVPISPAHRNCGRILAKAFQQTNVTNGSPSPPYAPVNFGIVCMQSAEDLAPGGGATAYAFVMDSLNGGNTVQLLLVNNGLSNSYGSGAGSTYTRLYTTAPNAWVYDQGYTLELFWQSDPYFLKGTRLIGTFNGNQLFDFVHTGPGSIARSTSSGEGIFASAITNQAVIVYEYTLVTPIVINSVNGLSYPPVVG